MRFLRMVVAVLFVAAGLAFPAAAAAQTPSVKGGGTTDEMSQFAALDEDGARITHVSH